MDVQSMDLFCHIHNKNDNNVYHIIPVIDIPNDILKM